jgi:hypothetical protein
MGEVTGKISGDEMSFVKQMPVMTMRLLSTGERKLRNKKHGAIYYTGVFSADRKVVEGQWRIKARFVWFGIIPMRVNPGSGSWEMRIVD